MESSGSISMSVWRDLKMAWYLLWIEIKSSSVYAMNSF